MQTETPIAKLLVVDDDRIIRETLHELLSVTELAISQAVARHEHLSTMVA